MSEFEDPQVTILRLVENNLRVVLDSGGLATFKCAPENLDRELLKNYDVTFTVSVPECASRKLTLCGKQRVRNYTMKGVLTCQERLKTTADRPQAMRSKATESILAILQQNRRLPYQSLYNFYPLGPAGETQRVYDGAATSELVPTSTSWAELSSANYAKVWSLDAVDHSKSTSVLNQYGLMLFRFKIGLKAGELRNEAREQCLTSISIALTGHGTAPAGNGLTFKIWDHVAAAWGNAATGTAAIDETITKTLTTTLTNYVDANGYLWVLARTTNSSDGATAAVVYCDFIQVTTQVSGVKFADYHSFRNIDETRVKPYVYKAEFNIVAWLYETLTT
jgi:hypothetical protein